MISFNNTEIAFRSKNDKDLKRAYLLFKVIGSPTMVKIGKVLTNFALKIHLPIEGIIKKTIFKQFCGGTSIADCKETIEHLAKYNVGTILDYSVEGKTSDKDFEFTVNEIIETIIAASKSNTIPFAVFKVTGLARFQILEKTNDPNAVLTEEEQNEIKQVIDRIDRICKAGFEHNIPVFIDAEETWIQDIIDRITEDMIKKYNKEKAIIFNTVQMYRHDRLAYLKTQIEIAKNENFFLGIKLVRGAYMEKERDRAQQMGYPSPIQKDKKSSDQDFNEALKLMVENLNYCAFCAGSHNEESAIILADLMSENKISKDDKRIWFAQLLGMSDHISFNMSFNGYNVAKYVPYGPIREVMPYLLRRADENTSVAGQTGRELSLIIKEKNRRKGK